MIGWSHPVAQTLTSWCLAAQKTTHLVLRAFAAHHHRRPTTTAQCTDTPPRPPRPPPAVRTCSRAYGRRLKRAARVARGDLTRLHENVLNRQLADLNPTVAKGGQLSKGDVFWPYLMRIETGLLLTYAKVTGAWRRFWWSSRGGIPTRIRRFQYNMDGHGQNFSRTPTYIPLAAAVLASAPFS